ncbi:polysaccharide export outer membrane protein [Hymenobacter qilianensis]|uniref:Polysaccharide export outer membrane protein n=1 Tax=Hymenobacter qilianensis TaxID=1385715 RepID=A0ACB5PS73_9BACT|nr:polysaccharide biosynthesis/export family protein [Hymenobacter qilianensis]GGF66681.1 polysaccharide export outer membrane protein [Hymenobacter qilianensis]
MIRPLYAFAILLLSGITSCVSTKDISYLQDSDYSGTQAKAITNERQEYKLATNDVLNITVQSAQPELTQVFNLNTGQGNFINGDPGSQYTNGYVVDAGGNITLPTAGRLPVRGLTVSEAQRVIQNAVNNYVRGATASVKLVSFKITVLGEVRNPGYFFIQNPQATILEALGLAGDLTPLGNRRNVKLIRQTPTGSEVVLLNLTKPNLLSSPYYYLQPNDAVYVEPESALTQRANLTNLSLVFAGLTTIAVITNLIISANR